MLYSVKKIFFDLFLEFSINNYCILRFFTSVFLYNLPKELHFFVDNLSDLESCIRRSYMNIIIFCC